MRTAEKYGNYKMHVEWRWIGEGTNSGIFHRVQDGDKVWPNAIECQLCSGKAGDYVMLPLKSATNKYSLNLVYKDTKFRLSKMSDNAPAWGVAMLIRNLVIGL